MIQTQTCMSNLTLPTGTGALYVFYAFTAFFLSKPVITMTGPKIGLVLGVGGYCVYILGFLLAIVLKGSIRWPVFIFAACVGGMAGGLLWTAQGRYFSKNAALYSEGTVLLHFYILQPLFYLF